MFDKMLDQMKRMPLSRGAAGLAVAVALLAGGSSLSAYEGDWTDKKLDGQATEPNSWFKVFGQLWGGYEFANQKADRSLDYQGFTLGRAAVNLQGQGKSGSAEGWGYRIQLEANTSNGSAFTGSSAPPTPFLKYAYFQVPVAKGTYFRVGFQHSPVVDGQAGSSLEGAWGHRYLDADGKAMWDELGLSSSSDAGIGFIHKNDLFGIHLLLANGEGYTGGAGVNAKGYAATCAGTAPSATATSYTPCTTGFIDTTALVSGTTVGQATARRSALSAIGQGTAPSYGLDVFGLVSLTPLKSEKDSGVDFSINFPFRLSNVYGMREQEFRNVVNLDANPAAPSYSIVNGDPRAKRDYAYGMEVDAKIKLGTGSYVAAGAGAVRKVDMRGNVYAFDKTTEGMALETYLANGYFYQGSSAAGQARYAFAHMRAGMFGAVVRYSTGTGTGSTSDRLGTSTSNPMVNEANQNVLRLTSTTPATVDQGLAALVNADKGDAHFRKITAALTFMPNERLSFALGIHQITATDGLGTEVKVNPYSASILPGSTTVTPGQYIASLDPAAQTMYTQKLLNDVRIYGVRDVDRQTFVRMQYLF